MINVVKFPVLIKSSTNKLSFSLSGYRKGYVNKANIYRFGKIINNNKYRMANAKIYFHMYILLLIN